MTERKVLLWHNALKIDAWCTHEDYPLEDWQYEVANDYTRQSYRDWVTSMIEQEDITIVDDPAPDTPETAAKKAKDARRIMDQFWAAMGGRE